MQLSYSFLATLMAAVVVSGQPLAADVHSPAVRTAQPFDVEAAGGAPAIRDVSEIPTIDVGPAANDLDASNVAEVTTRELEKRVFNVHVLANTGNTYRATFNGIVILCNIYFDLAVNAAFFRWYPDSSNPGATEIKIGIKDLNTGRIVRTVKALTHHESILLPGVRYQDTINIFR